jgi:predicted glycosyltransferase
LASGNSGITLEPFARNFISELAGADLSISMAGYNTCMDILSSKVKALVYPFPQNREQPLRANKLQKMKLLKVLESLDVDYLCDTIRKSLEAPYRLPKLFPNLSGAQNSALAVAKYFGLH